MSLFNIPDEVLQDKEIINIIDGIAGSAKSSNIDRYFQGQYKRYTSTVKLMKDAIARYGCDCDTIAGGLFTAGNGQYFIDYKEPDTEVVVIDEILQTSPRVLEWCEKYRGLYKIIITTDSCQMLPQHGGSGLKRTFEEFCKKEFVHYTELTYSFRPVNEETRVLYTELYNSVNDKTFNAFEFYRNKFDTIKYEDMPFNGLNVYLTHTNEIEDFLYRDKDIIHRDDIDFIPKGCIAKRQTINEENYPRLSQLQAEKSRTTNYLQASNIGSVTRYQGSEVMPEQKCYFIIAPGARVGNREFYTALTRCKDMNSFCIVYCTEAKKKKLAYLNGYRVKDQGTLYFDNVPENIKVNENFTIADKDLEKLTANMETDEYVYNCDHIFIDRQEYRRESDPKEEEEKNTRKTLYAIFKKYPEFDISYMEEVYEVLGQHGILELNTPHIHNYTKKDDFRYDLDLFSAYPSVFAETYVPIDGKLWTDEDTVPKGYIFFYYVDCDLFPETIVAGDLAGQLLEMHKSGEIELKALDFVFACPCVRRHKAGQMLKEQAYKSVETKADLKELHWGWLEQNYLDFGLNVKYNEKGEAYGDEMRYVRKPQSNKELIFCAIVSHMYYIVLKMSEHLNIKSQKYIQVDAIHFNDASDMLMKSKNWGGVLKEYDWRIEEKATKKIIYKTYEDLKTKKDIEREQRRERDRRYKAKKKAEKEAKEKEEAQKKETC